MQLIQAFLAELLQSLDLFEEYQLDALVERIKLVTKRSVRDQFRHLVGADAQNLARLCQVDLLRVVRGIIAFAVVRHKLYRCGNAFLRRGGVHELSLVADNPRAVNNFLHILNYYQICISHPDSVTSKMIVSDGLINQTFSAAVGRSRLRRFFSMR
jgi:hypothetical protein